MNWGTRRKFIYGLVIILTVTACGVYSLRDVLFPAPTCFDTKQNGYESGIDCGGTCSLRCTQEISPLTVKWTRMLLIAPRRYDFVAMVSNKNIDNAPHALGYSFVVMNESGAEIATINGTTTAPVDGDFPIIKQDVTLPENPKEVIVKLHDGPHYTVLEKPTSPTIRTIGTRYEAGSIPKVFATILNTKRTTLSNIPVRAVLYDVNDNAFAVGETVVPFLDKEGRREISFTWGGAFEKAPTRILIYPIFDPFLKVQ